MILHLYVPRKNHTPNIISRRFGLIVQLAEKVNARLLHLPLEKYAVIEDEETADNLMTELEKSENIIYGRK